MYGNVELIPQIFVDAASLKFLVGVRKRIVKKPFSWLPGVGVKDKGFEILHWLYLCSLQKSWPSKNIAFVKPA